MPSAELVVLVSLDGTQLWSRKQGIEVRLARRLYPADQLAIAESARLALEQAIDVSQGATDEADKDEELKVPVKAGRVRAGDTFEPERGKKSKKR